MPRVSFNLKTVFCNFASLCKKSVTDREENNNIYKNFNADLDTN